MFRKRAMHFKAIKSTTTAHSLLSSTINSNPQTILNDCILLLSSQGTQY